MRVKNWRIAFLAIAAMTARAGFADTATTKPVPPALPVFKIGEAVEVKSGNTWDPAKIVNRDGDVYWVNYDKFKDKFFNEWVTLDRIRHSGETRDTPGWATPTAHGQKPTREARLQALVNLGLATPATEDGIGGGTDSTIATGRAAVSGALATINWSGVKEIGMAESGKGYVADPEEAGKWSGASVGLGPLARGGAEGSVRLMGLMATSAETGKIGVQYEDWAARSMPLRVQIADLKTSQANVVISLPPGEKALGLSPDGKRVLTVLMKEGTDWNGTIVDVGEIHGTGVKSLAMFMPGSKEEEAWREVTWGAFVDNDHVLVEDEGGRVTLFSIGELKAVYTTMEGHSRPGLSANGKYAALPTTAGTAIVEALTGETVLALKGGTWNGGAVFRGDGARVAVYEAGRIRVYDLGKRELASDIFLPPKMVVTELDWVAPDHLLMNGTYLVSVPKGLILWRYEAPERSMPGRSDELMLGGKLWVAAVRSVGTGARVKGARTLAAVTLPDAAAKEMEAKLPVDDVMAVHPGVKVTLDVQAGNDEGNAALVKQWTEALTKNGMVVEAGQAIQLQARVSSDKSHEMEYQRFGSLERTRMTVNDMKATVSFVVDGKEAWTWSAIQAAPMFLQMKEGESIEQAIAAEQAKAWHLLEGAELPKMLPRPRETPEFGTSPLVPGAGRK